MHPVCAAKAIADASGDASLWLVMRTTVDLKRVLLAEVMQHAGPVESRLSHLLDEAAE
jgi:hypothetical protein